MEFFQRIKFLAGKALVFIVLLFLLPLFVIRAGIWLVKMFFNDQEAIKELHYFEQE